MKLMWKTAFAFQKDAPPGSVGSLLHFAAKEPEEAARLYAAGLPAGKHEVIVLGSDLSNLVYECEVLVEAIVKVQVKP